MQDKVAHLFPAFTLKYTGKETDIIYRANYPFSELLKKATDIIGDELTNFHIIENNYLQDELKNQYLSYLFSCAFSDILKQKNLSPNYVGGFSMGIYAALYHSGSIDFITGLELIKNVFLKVKEILNGAEYAMASVIGFTQTDINTYLKAFKKLECVIQNGDVSFVICGPSNELNQALDLLHIEGAMHIARFTVSCPYHSGILKAHQNEFVHLIDKLAFNNLEIPLISFIDNRILKSSAEVRQELVKNVCSSLNFYRAIKELEKKGVKSFLEIGPGDSLTKSSKFIDGDFRFKALAKGFLI